MPESVAHAAVLTREQVLTALVQPLEAASVFLAAGPRIVDTAGPLRVPYAPSYPDAPAPMTGENELIPEVVAEFEDMQLLPSTMKSFKVIDRWSNELARQSYVAIESVLRTRLVQKVAADVDAQLMGATGDGLTSPRGLGAYTGVQEVKVGGPLTLDWILAAQGRLLAANAPVDGLTLFMRPEDFMSLRMVHDTQTGAFIVQPDVNRGGLIVPVLGARVIVTDRVAKGSAYLLHMPSILVARDVAPAVTLLPERYADYDQVGVRVVTRLDAAPLHPEAVVRFTGLDSTKPITVAK